MIRGITHAYLDEEGCAMNRRQVLVGIGVMAAGGSAGVFMTRRLWPYR
jgi:hypothetical protein